MCGYVLLGFILMSCWCRSNSVPINTHREPIVKRAVYLCGHNWKAHDDKCKQYGASLGYHCENQDNDHAIRGCALVLNCPAGQRTHVPKNVNDTHVEVMCVVCPGDQFTLRSRPSNQPRSTECLRRTTCSNLGTIIADAGNRSRDTACKCNATAGYRLYFSYPKNHGGNHWCSNNDGACMCEQVTCENGMHVSEHGESDEKCVPNNGGMPSFVPTPYSPTQSDNSAGTSPLAAKNETTKQPDSGGMTTGVKIGLGIGISVAVGIIIGVLVWCRKRSDPEKITSKNGHMDNGDLSRDAQNGECAILLDDISSPNPDQDQSSNARPRDAQNGDAVILPNDVPPTESEPLVPGSGLRKTGPHQEESNPNHPNSEQVSTGAQIEQNRVPVKTRERQVSGRPEAAGSSEGGTNGNTVIIKDAKNVHYGDKYINVFPGSSRDTNDPHADQYSDTAMDGMSTVDDPNTSQESSMPDPGGGDNVITDDGDSMIRLDDETHPKLMGLFTATQDPPNSERIVIS